MLATVSGGEKVRVRLDRSGAELANVGGVQIKRANFTLTPEKKFLFAFEFADTRKRPLRHVLVEDVSDAAPVSYVDDAQPKLSADGGWHGEAQPLDISDPRLSWMATISNTLRVFRFTLTFADGQTSIIHQGAFYPAGMKSAVRQAAGLKY